ncbi:hypothetical protein MIB92_03500 [Aestuariirhabdus sp. Z084]|uniref:hypothetical protein n=1 Tax=Aestuariirhabdus haliotis TaxID=2918751 RepID=UPI00201B3705|nr:hypothetical protein [Aestuariirhabdus haliotis]MCL6414706.1 hypothetical protein [Aestuariirhabdus haliotis]MCL6418638.1 hypothetical protein [Aestuariirhabdus haliotis]
MILDVEGVEDARIPALGWVLCANYRSGQVRVLYGEHVEWLQDVMVEGVWSEPFESARPQASKNLFGSCVAFSRDSLLLCPSTATSEPIFFQFINRVLYAANSLVLLLAALNDSLKVGCQTYKTLNEARTRGLENTVLKTPTTNGSINRLIHHNLKVESAGWVIQEKTVPEPFRRFSSYKQYLQSSLWGCLDNAKATSRKFPFQLVTTQSRGYDSTAVNALLGPHKPDRAFTCKDSKPVGEVFRKGQQSRGPSDDGSEISAQLGFECDKLERDAFLQNLDLEILFNAAVHNNEDRNLQPIFNLLGAPSLLLTGTMGELWYNQRSMEHANFEKDADNLLKRADLSGFGMSEARLWKSIIHIPVPYIGARQRESIHQITESEEMDPWRLNNDYDRPISRRIAEEAGVKRESFGQKKMGSVVLMPMPELPLASNTRRDYLEDLVRNKLLSPWQKPVLGAVQRYNNWIRWTNPNRYFSNHRRYPAFYYLSRLIEKLTGKRFRFRPLLGHLEAELYRYSCNRIVSEYTWLSSAFRSTSVTHAANENSQQNDPGSEHLKQGEGLTQN